MGAYMRPWLLLAVLFVITCLTASPKVEKGISEPEDQEDSGSGEAEEPSTCGNDTCSGNGQCTVETHGDKSVAVCECDYGVSGRWCNDISQRSYTTYCSPNPCRIGETCKVNAYGFFCRCRAGYFGERCENRHTIGCTPATCGVHGDCVLSKCECHPGWKGELCDVTPCIPNPCKRGRCTTVNESFKCVCEPGYNGPVCGSYNDRCNPNPCANGEICTLSTTGIARCRPSCEPNPCLNGGICTIDKGKNKFVCLCRAGHFGERCQTPHTISCKPGTCGVHGNCVSSKCQCHFGWKGELCDVSPCSPNPCLHHGECSAINGQFQCACLPLFTGVRCGRRKCFPSDPCRPVNPCHNGGSCSKTGSCSKNGRQHSYTCACLPGTSGRLCQGFERSQDSPCNPNPCHGGCKCVPSCRHANGYYCSGTNGLLGRNCQIPAPLVVCGENAISVSIDAAVVNEYDPGVGQFTMFMALSHMMIPNPTCPAENQGNSYSLTLPLPFNNCGTEVVTNADGKTIVSNYIWLNRLIASGVADMPVPILHFTCEYEQQYSVITSLTPGIDIPPTIVSHGERTDSAVIDLCKSGNFCPSQCPEMYSLSRGATYTVGEELFLRITPTRVGTRFRISDLFLSCSSDPATTYASSPIVLLANGCFAIGSGNYLPTNVQSMAAGVCASFPVPLLRSCAMFYIHAKLQSCSPGVCVSAYTPCSRRRKRSDKTSEESDENPGIQVFGPIVVIEGKEGVSTKVMYPDEEYVNSTNTGVLVFKDEALPTIPGSSSLLPLYVALGVLLVVAVAVFGFLVGHNWHYIHAHCGRKV